MTKIIELLDITDVQPEDKVIIHDVSEGKDRLGTIQDVIDQTTGAVTSVNGQVGGVSLSVENLEDTDTTGKTNGDLLGFNSTSSNWEPIDPATLAVESNAGGTLYSDWLADLSGISAPPASGKVMWNNVTQTTATKLFLHYTTDTGKLLDGLAKTLLDDNGEIFLFDITNVNNFQRWSVTGYTDNLTYAEVDVVLLGGTATFTSDQPLKVGLSPESNKADAVSSVNGEVGDITLDLTDINDTAISSPVLNQVLTYNGTVWVNQPAQDAITTVNGQTGAVELDADDIDDSLTDHKFTTQLDIDKLFNIEANAQRCDEFNVITALNGAEMDEIPTIKLLDRVFLQDSGNNNDFDYVTVQDLMTLAPTGLVTSVNGQIGDVVLDADDIDDSLTTHKFTSQTEIDKLAGIEALADVTDEDNVTDALDGATLPTTTVESGDQVLIQDVSDASSLKTVTAQGIADLVSQSLDDLTDVDVTTVSPVNGDSLVFNSTSGLWEASATGSGEINTASNLGAGEEVFAQKSGADLEFKSLVAGTNVTLSSDGDEITINASGGGGGGGDVSGPGSSTDNALVRWDGATGTIVQNSTATLSDTGALVIESGLDVGNEIRTLATTGLRTGGVLSVNAGDSTLFDISAGQGHVVDHSTDPSNPTITEVSWADFTGATVSNPTALVTYVGITSAGSIVSQNTPFTNEQERSTISLGTVITLDGVNVTNVAPTPNLISGSQYLSLDLAQALGRITSGNTITPNGANLNLDREAGTTFGAGSNYYGAVNSPNVLPSVADSNISWTYNYQDGVGGGTVVTGQTAINPNLWDDGSGTLQAVPNNRYTNQRVSFFPEFGDVYVIQYGQELFQTQIEAEAAALSSTWANPSNIEESGFRTVITLKKDATDLTDENEATFTNTGKFGYGGGVGGGTTNIPTRQDTYDASLLPQTITDSTRGADTWRRGSALDTDDVLAVENGAGTGTFSITGEGKVTSTPSVMSLGGKDLDVTGGVSEDNYVMTYDFASQKIQLEEVNGFDDSALTDDKGIAVWNDSTKLLETNTPFTYDSVTGVFSVGDFKVDSGNGYVEAPQRIGHYLDSNTYLDFNSDELQLYAGGSYIARFLESGGNDFISMGDNGSQTIFTVQSDNGVDFRVRYGDAVMGASIPDASAKMDLNSTDKGFLAPRMTEVQRDAIVSPATGLLVYNLDDAKFNQYNGTAWEELGGSGAVSSPLEESFVATASQTNFTLASVPSAAWVWINGLAQDASSWSISGNDIVLDTGATVGDSVEVYYMTSIGGVTANTLEELSDVTYGSLGPGITLGDSLLWTGTEWSNFPLTETLENINVLAVDNKVGTSYTLTGEDQYVRMDNASAVTVTVPLEATESLPVGFQVVLRQVGAGQVTVAPEGAVVINTSDTLKLRTTHSTATLIKVDTDEWDLAGDLEVV